MPNKYTDSYQNPQGPGDARPTADQIIKDENLAGAWLNKKVVVTGVSSGMGIPTVRALAATGAHVYGTVRNLTKGKEALADLVDAGKVELVEMDNGSLDSVRAAGKVIMQKCGGKLNILICNAGIMLTPYSHTKDGFESQFGTNHVAHFLLFQLLKDALLAGATADASSRVVMVSSMGHKWGDGVDFEDPNYKKVDAAAFVPARAYGQSKTANIYMANQIDRLYGAQGIHAYSLHPGGVHTGLQVHVPKEQIDSWQENPMFKNYMSNAEQGAATQVFAAVGKQWEDKGGVYMEECDVALPEDETKIPMLLGYKAHAYDQEKEERLWKESLSMVGMS